MGVILSIAPWNAPLTLSVRAVAIPIVCGNTVVLKPSEQTPAFSKLIAELLPKYLDPELYHVINGGVPETTQVPLVAFVRSGRRSLEMP